MKSIYTALMLVAVLASASTLQAQSKIGHINFQELLTTMPEAKTVQSQIEGYSTELNNTYQQYINELQTRQTDYQTNGASWSDVKREAAEQDMQSLLERIQQFELTSQEKLLNKQNELMTPLIDKAQNAVKAVGSEQGLTYIMDSSTLLHIGADAVDVMPFVKTKLNL